MKNEDDFDVSQYICKEGQVFVHSVFDPEGVVRIKDRADVKNTDVIIVCDRCEVYPARRIDHNYPYYKDFNLCADCLRDLDMIDKI